MYIHLNTYVYLNFNKRQIISFLQFRYISSRFDEVNDRLHVLYSDLFENNADCKRQNKCLLVRQRITGAKNRKHYTWIIM